MIKIKLMRTGAKNRPSFRIIVAPERSKLNGRPLAQIGFYDPKTKPPTVKIERKKLEFWLARGAQLTPSVRKLSQQNEKTT